MQLIDGIGRLSRSSFFVVHTNGFLYYDDSNRFFSTLCSVPSCLNCGYWLVLLVVGIGTNLIFILKEYTPSYETKMSLENSIPQNQL